jgi:hypothetical protein
MKPANRTPRRYPVVGNGNPFGDSSIIDDIVVSGYIEMANWEAERLRHYGFRRSNSYTIALSQGPEIDGLLRSLVAMLPVLAGQLY